MSTPVTELFETIQAIVLDIDGVLTDNKILVTDNGEFLRIMNVRDGYAIKRVIEKGIKVAIISGGRSIGTKKRLEILGIKEIHLGIEQKLPCLQALLAQWQIHPENVAYMGDDLMDIPCLQFVGLSCAPKDSVPEVLQTVKYISPQAGGDCCVRDLIEKVMQAKGLW